MYRIVIIDDEQVVREGISNNIPWALHGFELVAACRDGREGLAAIERLRPDVVLTDICMPFVDGLELAASIGEEYPATRTILLTGYDEFEYAQEAVKLKVHDFLLKPITADELTTMLISLREELDADRDRRAELDRLHEQLRASLPVYRERFLNRLVRSSVPPEELSRTVELLELDLPGPEYVTLICDLDPAEEIVEQAEAHLSGIALQNIVGELAGTSHGVAPFSTPREEVAAVISVRPGELALPKALLLAEEIAERAKRELSHTVTIGLGEGVESLGRLSRSFREARTALEHRFVLGGNQIITFDQVRGEAAGPPITADSQPRNRYIQAIKAGLAYEASTALGQFVASLRRERDDLDYCYVAMNRLLADTIGALEAVGVSYAELSAMGRNPFKQLVGMKTLEEMEAWFLALLDGARHLLDGRRRNHSESKAVTAEQYIREHYRQPDLSLQRVCRALAVSKSYLSAVFKAHTGMTLLEYLTSVRMEQAKLLLGGEDSKIYEIAEAVGFRDPHYFSLTFRKQVGLSPTEYREMAWSAAR